MGRQGLAEPELSGFFVECCNIGKRPADIRRQTDLMSIKLRAFHARLCLSELNAPMGAALTLAHSLPNVNYANFSSYSELPESS
jgi:hypothetical protein